MPRLETAAFCEKIIVDKGTGVASLIGLINVLTVRSEPVPQDAVAPTSWAVYVSHRIEPDDSLDTEYEQKIELIKPDGVVALEMATEPFRMAGTGHQQMYRGENFPVAQAGVYEIKVSMRRHGTPDWDVASSLKVIVRHPKPTPI